MRFLPQVSIKTKLFLSSFLSILGIIILLGSFFYFWFEGEQLNRVDEFLFAESRVVSGYLDDFFVARGDKAKPANLADTKEFLTFLDGYFQQRVNTPLPYKTTLFVYDDQNNLLANSNLALDLDLTDIEKTQLIRRPSKIQDTTVSYLTVKADGPTFRMIEAPLIFRNQQYGSIRLACLLTSALFAVNRLGPALVLLLLTIAVITGLLFFYQFNRLFRPVKAMTLTAEGITESRLDRRIPEPPGKDEIQLLAQTFNRMLARIESGFHFQEKLVGDLSHQLRTPLTILRGRNEVALKTYETKAEYVKLVEDNLADIDQLASLLNTLLNMARLESRIDPLHLEKTNLIALLKETLEELDPLWEELNFSFDFKLPQGALSLEVSPPVYLRAEPVTLKQAMINIFTNSAKFCPPGSRLSIAVTSLRRPEGLVCRLALGNNGPPLPQDALETIFRRFFRAEPTKGKTQGFGLGLSFVRSIVELHGGTVKASNLDKGVVFEFLFPGLE